MPGERINMIKYSVPDQARITHHEADAISFEAIADQTGVTSDGVLISEEVLKDSARWMLGRPVTIGPVGGPVGSSRAIGQVDESQVWPTGQLFASGKLFPQKLSSEQLQALKRAGQPLKAHAGFFLMTTPEAGSWKGKSYKEKAVSIQYDHLSLILPELKGHAAGSKLEKLERLNKQMDAALGRC
jgi:hypothetical protein